jgi:hypothetical protein
MGIQDAITLLDTKCNVTDVNEALEALQDRFLVKPESSEFQSLVEDVHDLRKQIRGELCFGRWVQT